MQWDIQHVHRLLLVLFVCWCVAELCYLSPSLCWSHHCRFHWWSKAGHLVYWHQLPWQVLKGAEKRCVKGRWKENPLTSTSCWQGKQSQGVHTTETEGAWLALPGRITQGRGGKCAKWAAMSAAQVSVWLLRLQKLVGVAGGQQSEIQGPELQTALTPASTTQGKTTASSLWAPLGLGGHQSAGNLTMIQKISCIPTCLCLLPHVSIIQVQ